MSEKDEIALLKELLTTQRQRTEILSARINNLQDICASQQQLIDGLHRALPELTSRVTGLAQRLGELPVTLSTEN